MEYVFPDILKQAIEGHLDTIHTAIPGYITAYDYTTKKASVQPAIKRVFADNTQLKLPIITNVPVVWPGTSKGVLHFEITPGKDSCLLVFSERSLENWLSTDPTSGDTEPGDPRQFSLADAICIPGLFSLSSPGKVGTTGKGVELLWDKGSISIDDSNKIGIKNDQQTMYDILVDIQALLNDIVSNSNWIGNMGAPVQFIPYATDHSKVTQLQTKISNLLQSS